MKVYMQKKIFDTFATFRVNGPLKLSLSDETYDSLCESHQFSFL